MRSFTIAIPEDAGAKLSELARRDFRAPRHEAAALLVEAIERASRRAQDAASRARPADVGERER